MEISETLSALEEIYRAYTQKLADVYAQAPIAAGLFGVGDDPRNHSCNDEFYQNVAQWAQNFASHADAQEAKAAVEWILYQPAREMQKPTYWYMYAAQKHAQPLIPLMFPQAKAEIRQQFLELYPKRDWTPVQKEVYQLLSADASGSRQKASILGWFSDSRKKYE